MIKDVLTFDWDAPVPETERDEILGKLAETVKKRGLETPAIWFLEIHRPLAPLGSQMAIAFSPFLGTLFAGGAFDLQKYTKLMQDTSNIDRLVRLLEGDDRPAVSPSVQQERPAGA